MATRNAINVLIKLLGGPEMVSELEKLGKSGEKAFKSIEGAANKVKLAQLGGALNTFGTDLARTMRLASLAVTGLAAGVAAAAPAVIALANSGAKAADAVGKAAQATGLQTEAFQKFQFAAEQSGASAEQFVTAMTRFGQEVVETANKVDTSNKKISGSFSKANRDIQQGFGNTVETFKEIGVQVTRFGDEVDKSGKKAAKGAKETTSAFTQLGISVRDSAGVLKTNEQLLLEVAEAFERMPDGARKSAIAVDLFGQGAARLIPFLNQGADGIRELMEQAEELGIIFTPEQIRAAQAYNDAVGALFRSISSLRNQIGLIFVPALTQAANAFRDVILRNREAILSFAEGAVKTAVVLVKDLILALTGDDANVQNTWIIEWRDAIVQFGQDFLSVINTVVLPAMELVRDAAGLVTEAINSIFNTEFTGGQLLIIATITQLIGGFALLRSTIMLVVQAVALLSRAFTLNPVLAVLSTIAVGIGMWATSTDAASLALESHQKLVNNVADAYRKAGGEVSKMTQEVKDRLFVETAAALEKTKAAIDGAFDSAAAELFVARQNEVFGNLIQTFLDGNKAVGDFIKEVSEIGRLKPELAGIAQEIINVVTPLEEFTLKEGFETDFLDVLSGKLSNADFKAKHFGDTLNAITPPKDVSKPLNDAADAAANATGEVDKLGKKITVTRFGEDGMNKEVFDVVDGIAKRSQAATTALDGVAQSAAQAGQEVQNVSNEVTNAVQDAVPPDAAAAPVDQVVADVERIAPAAEQAAAQTNAALSDIGNVSVGATNVAQAILQPFEDLQSRISVIFNNIRQVAQSGFQSIASLVSQLASQIQAEINRIIAALQRAAAAAARLRSQARSSSGRDESGGPGLAGGGPVHGRGSSTSDSNLFWLSKGEFVVKAAAVRKLGLQAMYAINRGLLPNLSKIRGLANGGLADNFFGSLSGAFSIPAPAGAGSIAPRSSNARPFTLVLSDGRTVTGLTADDDAVGQMKKFSLTASMLSAGRRPGRGK